MEYIRISLLKKAAEAVIIYGLLEKKATYRLTFEVHYTTVANKAKNLY
jgi:hypothetical protein